MLKLRLGHLGVYSESLGQGNYLQAKNTGNFTDPIGTGRTSGRWEGTFGSAPSQA